jgi:L-amino acid N-acyltransferase YncA
MRRQMKIVKQFSLRPATMKDVKILVKMNQDLIRDEKSENPMSLQQLLERMSRLLENNWHAELLLKDGQIIGYALFQYRSNAGRQEVFLRHYFIQSAHRGQGYGREGIVQLRDQVFPKDSILVIDVLESNPEGKAG